jgi:plasmid stabilization system protein ParE
MQSCFDYICERLHNPLAALAMIDEIEHLYTLLEDNPYMGEEHITGGGKAYRFLPVKNYLLFYTVQENMIIIRRFLYGPSNYDFLLDRS